MPADFFDSVFDCIMQKEPAAKCERTGRLAELLDGANLSNGGTRTISTIEIPGRPDRPVLVDPGEVPRRRLGSTAGRAALVHAIAHIEFNAINLALDAAYRFRGMPRKYYSDWISVAVDEARHFRMLQSRLRQMGQEYGDSPAHNGLWEMAVKTADSCLVRMALVPRVLEARGLDVTPGMMERLRSAGDGCGRDGLRYGVTPGIEPRLGEILQTGRQRRVEPGLSLQLPRQANGKRAPRAQRTLDRDLPVQELAQLFDDRQP